MADATYKTGESAVIQELLLRTNLVQGYPKVGKVANGATQVGGGIHAPDSQVVTDALTEVSVDSTDGTTYLYITDAYRTLCDAEKAAAAARIAGGTSVSFDAEIVALTEDVVAFGDTAQFVFNPRRIPNCEAWARADTGLTLAGANVTSWNAYTLTSGAVPFTQAVGANKPTATPSDTNGRTVITFDGNDFLDLPVGQIVQPATLYLCIRAANQAGDKTVLISADDDMRFRFSGNAFETFAGQTVSVSPVGGTNIFELVINGTQSLVGVNGPGPNNVILGINDGNGGLRLGAKNDGSDGLDGVICEFIYYSRVLNPLERFQVRKGLGAQYAIKVT